MSLYLAQFAFERAAQLETVNQSKLTAKLEMAKIKLKQAKNEVKRLKSELAESSKPDIAREHDKARQHIKRWLAQAENRIAEAEMRSGASQQATAELQHLESTLGHWSATEPYQEALNRLLELGARETVDF